MKLPWWMKAASHAMTAGDEETAAAIAAAQGRITAGDADPTETRLNALEKGQATTMQALALLGQGKRFKLGDAGIEEMEAEDEDDEDKDKEAGDEYDEDDKSKAGDSANLRAEWQSVISLAEILAPGCPTRLPAMDSKMTVKNARDAMCKCRRAAMDHAMGTQQGRDILSPLLRGRALDAIKCDEQSVIFQAAAEIARSQNNFRTSAGDAVGVFVVPDTGSLYQSMYGSH